MGFNFQDMCVTFPLKGFHLPLEKLFLFKDTLIHPFITKSYRMKIFALKQGLILCVRYQQVDKTT